jgi:hypothetical protein
MGPDFKSQFVDLSPISNADIAPTFAQILGFDMASKGALKGRVLREALADGPASISAQRRTIASTSAANGMRTVLSYQETGKQVYFDEACFTHAKASGAHIACP